MEWLNAAPEVFLSFDAGCAAGYGFALRTALKNAQERMSEREILCEKRLEERDSTISELKGKIENMERVFWPEHERRMRPRVDDD